MNKPPVGARVTGNIQPRPISRSVARCTGSYKLTPVGARITGEAPPNQ